MDFPMIIIGQVNRPFRSLRCDALRYSSALRPIDNRSCIASARSSNPSHSAATYLRRRRGERSWDCARRDLGISWRSYRRKRVYWSERNRKHSGSSAGRALLPLAVRIVLLAGSIEPRAPTESSPTPCGTVKCSTSPATDR